MRTWVVKVEQSFKNERNGKDTELYLDIHRTACRQLSEKEVKNSDVCLLNNTLDKKLSNFVDYVSYVNSRIVTVIIWVKRKLGFQYWMDLGQ